MFRSVTFFSLVMPAHLNVDMITMINCFSSICFTPCLRSGSHRWNQELFATARGMDSQRSHRSFVFLSLRNEVDFWVEVNFWKKWKFFCSIKKNSNFNPTREIINRRWLRRKILNKTKPDLLPSSPPCPFPPSSVLTRRQINNKKKLIKLFI